MAKADGYDGWWLMAMATMAYGCRLWLSLISHSRPQVGEPGHKPPAIYL
jgi:hypothetical protein